MITTTTRYWQIAAFGFGPDLALPLGYGLRTRDGYPRP
jgi:hypothetical protein